MIGKVGRAAGNLLGIGKKSKDWLNVGKRFNQSGLNVWQGGKINPEALRELAMSSVFDVGFGAYYGAMTPGDLGDKIISGTTSAAGGFLGSAGLRGGLGINSKHAWGLPMMVAEGVGGIGGDALSAGIADEILRAKGGGTTPWEKLQLEERKLLEQEILRNFLSGKGGYTQNPTLMSSDPTLVNNGLG